MNAWQFEVTTALRIVGFTYIALPLAVLFVLRGKHATSNLVAWCGGGIAFGIGSALTGLRGTATGAALLPLAHLLIIGSYVARVGALELEMDGDPQWRRKWLGLAALSAAYLAVSAWSSTARQLTYYTVLWLGVGWLVWTAWTVYRRTGLTNARLIAVPYAVLLLAGGIAIIQIVSAGGDLRPRGSELGVVLTTLTGLVTGLFSSLGYVGLAIERSHRRDLQRTQELTREAAQRHAAEQHATQLQSWLEEREELVRLLAHEVRQPLNNAMAALHATHRALGARDLDFETVSHRVRRAEGVLGQITSALDNTLAATALLASPDRVAPRDVDVDMLTALSIGDLAPELRKRIQVQRMSQVRTATMDAGLMRLALRNLLSNAGTYTPPSSPIVLRVTDSEDPLGLVFSVIDQGPGIAPGLAARLFQRGVRGQHDGGGHGLGLYVVRRVMELHGGTVDAGNNPGGGAVFRLTLPQTDQAYSAPMPLEA